MIHHAADARLQCRVRCDRAGVRDRETGLARSRGHAGRAAAIRSRALRINPRAVTAPTTTAPPSTDHEPGRSPNAIATQTGDRIGSITATRVASIAVAWRSAHA